MVRARATSRMFSRVTRTWNPVVGCLHDCVYCWARRLTETRLRRLPQYRGGFRRPTFVPRAFARKFRSDDVVFVVDMGDLFGDWVPRGWIEMVLAYTRLHPRATFVFLTKNPRRYHEFIDNMPANAVLGATIETNRDDLAGRVSKAPPPSRRYEAMRSLRWPRKLISIEPILDFDLDTFIRWIIDIQPEIVYIGYDNYGHRLPEPPLAKTMTLAASLKQYGITVEMKTVRRAWYEDA